MVYVYGFCEGNAVSVAVYNQRQFLRTTEYRLEVSTPLRDTGTLPAIRVTAKREIYQSVNEEESCSDGTA